MKFIKRRVSTRKIKRNMIAMFSLLTLGLSIASPVIQTFANDDESTVKDGLNDYKGDSKYSHEVLGKFSSDTPDGREQTFRYLFSRIVQPQYINNVSDGVDPSGADTSLIVNGMACDPSRPDNLIDSNCNIPNFSAQLGQSIMRVINPGGIVGAERNSATPALNWGVPNSIPTGTVPVDEAQRSSKYTGLEVFGYNLNYTDYNGEWDDIIPSTRARMLANFGIMDKINLTGTAIWDGVSSGISEFVEGLEWNPTTWLGNISNSLEAGASAPFITIIDTSDRNIVTSKSWTRSGNSVADSFYNVKVLTDKEVMEATTVRVANRFTAMLMNEIDNDSELAAVLELESPPNFVYDPNLESEKSKKARAEAEKKNQEIDAYNKEVDAHNAEVDKTGKGEKKEHKDKVKVPAKEFVPESEQFAKFKKEDGRVKQGESKGISCSDIDNYSDYKTCWNDKWKSYRSKEFNAKSTILTKLIEKVQKNLFKDDPYSDPTKAISHYVCADSRGDAMKDSNGNYEYLYTKENEGSQEFLNPKCSLVRPTIQGGYFGDGYSDGSKITDTRHISNVSGSSVLSSIPVIGNISKGIQNLAQNVSKFIAQLINEMLNLSFSPLMEKLGITTIVKSSINSFKNTIFYPMLVIVIMFAGLMMIWDVLRTRNATKFLTSLLSMLIIFFVGVTILNSPDKVVDFFDKLPAKGEEMIANVILNNENSEDICSTSSSDTNNGVRSAQCNVWQSLVFQPWVYGQWGTHYKNLNAAGTGGTTLKNTNGELVGNAEVNLGGGSKLNNWALYQLKLMTSGTITTEDSNKPVGKVDSNIYRVVDAQAGPNNAEGRDTRYFTTWQGAGASRMGTALESAVLSVFSLIVIGSLLLVKIELTFIFSIMMLGLPFILLYGLTPRGKSKLISYLSTMLALMIKRVLATALISLLLLLLNIVVPENADSYHIVFLSSMIVLGFFKIYKNEIFNLFNLSPENALAGEGILSGDPEALRHAIKNNIPSPIRNRAFMISNGVKGAVSGQIGGTMGGMRGAWETMRTDAAAQGKFITKSPTEIAREIRAGAKSGSAYGRQSGQRAQEQRARNAMTRKGIDVFTMNTEVKDEIMRSGSNRIKDGSDGLASQVNEEINKKRQFSRQDSSEPMSAKEQKQARNIAKQISKQVENEINGQLTQDEINESRRSISDRIEDAGAIRDQKDINQERINKFKHPIASKKSSGLVHNEVKVQTNVDDIKEHASHTVGKYSDDLYSKVNESDTTNPINNESTKPLHAKDEQVKPRNEFGAPNEFPELSQLESDEIIENSSEANGLKSSLNNSDSETQNIDIKETLTKNDNSNQSRMPKLGKDADDLRSEMSVDNSDLDNYEQRKTEKRFSKKYTGVDNSFEDVSESSNQGKTDIEINKVRQPDSNSMEKASFAKVKKSSFPTIDSIDRETKKINNLRNDISQKANKSGGDEHDTKN